MNEINSCLTKIMFLYLQILNKESPAKIHNLFLFQISNHLFLKLYSKCILTLFHSSSMKTTVWIKNDNLMDIR